MTLLLALYVRTIHNERFVSAWTLFVSSLIGQSYNISGHVEKRVAIRIGLGPWFLVSVIFTQGMTNYYIAAFLNFYIFCANLTIGIVMDTCCTQSLEKTRALKSIMYKWVDSVLRETMLFKKS